MAGASFGNIESWSIAGTFTAQEDLTLHQVHFSVATQKMAVGTDPSFIRPVDLSSQEFQLRSEVNLHWTDLAFPVPKGTTLYWAINGGKTTDQLIALIFT